MNTKEILFDLNIALIILANSTIVARLAYELFGCMEDDTKSPTKILKHYLKISIITNGITGIIAIVTYYFRGA